MHSAPKRCHKMELKLKYAKDGVPVTRRHDGGEDHNGRRYNTAESLKSKRISVIFFLIVHFKLYIMYNV